MELRSDNCDSSHIGKHQTPLPVDLLTEKCGPAVFSYLCRDAAIPTPRSHSPGDECPLCLYLQKFGGQASSKLLLSQRGPRSLYWHSGLWHQCCDCWDHRGGGGSEVWGVGHRHRHRGRIYRDPANKEHCHPPRVQHFPWRVKQPVCSEWSCHHQGWGQKL